MLERFLSRFTLIDILGIFVPGGILVLVGEAGGIPLAGLGAAFFGGGGVALGFYYVLLSYTVGLILMEGSSLLTRLLFGSGNPCVAPLQGKGCSGPYHDKLKAMVLARFGLDIGDAAVWEEVYWLVYQLVLQEGRGIKVQMFNGFYLLFRNLAAVVLLSGLFLLLRFGLGALAALSPAAVLLIPAGLLLLVLLLYRKASRFKKLAVMTIYAEFIILSTAAKKPGAQKPAAGQPAPANAG